MTPPRLWKLPIDFFARREHYLDHIAPVWNALNEETRGTFYVPAHLEGYARQLGLQPAVLQSASHDPMRVSPDGFGPLVVAAYGDMMMAIKRVPQRPIIFMEHGVGLSFGTAAYSGGGGSRSRIGLFLEPNEHVRAKNAKSFPKTPGVVIGTPKFDQVKMNWDPALKRGAGVGKPTVCISFHRNGDDEEPEAGTAFKHYMKVLPELARSKSFKLIGHGHPRYRFVLAPAYHELGIEAVWDFSEVMERADLYVNDCSSTMYEFCLTGKPVVILNAPEFRRDKHWGIRFWEYSDVGPQVDDPADLMAAILGQLDAVRKGVDPFAKARKRAVRDLYPYRGKSAKRAAEAIEEFTGRCQNKRARKIRTINGQSVGIVYMAFGKKSAEGVISSANSLRCVGLDIPICVVGDTPVEGMQFIEWPGQSPFDGKCAQNFQFRAGRIKPGLYELIPFERTLYIDADTEFMSKKVLDGWKYLDDHDMALAQELLEIGQLYNKPRAGWEINIKERDATIKFLGGDPKVKFLNSGVIFFRKSDVTAKVFKAWGEEWLKWQQWDEQLSLIRAIHRCQINIKMLDPEWNHPHRDQAKIIFHNYGRGVVRINVN